MREMLLMEALGESAELSQSELARRVGLTPARVNSYIHDFIGKRYITTSHRSRGLAYHLTPEGRHCLAYHRVSYRAELVRLSSDARARFQQFFRDLRALGIGAVACYGAGETGEVVLDALAGTGLMDIRCVLDDDPAKHGTSFHGFTVQSPDRIADLDIQAVVITSVVCGAALHARLLARDDLGAVRVYSLAT